MVGVSYELGISWDVCDGRATDLRSTVLTDCDMRVHPSESNNVLNPGSQILVKVRRATCRPSAFQCTSLQEAQQGGSERGWIGHGVNRWESRHGHFGAVVAVKCGVRRHGKVSVHETPADSRQRTADRGQKTGDTNTATRSQQRSTSNQQPAAFNQQRTRNIG